MKTKKKMKTKMFLGVLLSLALVLGLLPALLPGMNLTAKAAAAEPTYKIQVKDISYNEMSFGLHIYYSADSSVSGAS